MAFNSSKVEAKSSYYVVNVQLKFSFMLSVIFPDR